MVSQKVTVSNPTGIHARPAATLAKTAAPFKSSIILVAGEKRLQAKSCLLYTSFHRILTVKWVILWR